MPTLCIGQTRMAAWATIPSVENPPSMATRIADHCETSALSAGPAPPKIARMTSRPATDTTLLSTGAHMYGPKFSRALRICPRTVYMP